MLVKGDLESAAFPSVQKNCRDDNDGDRETVGPRLRPVMQVFPICPRYLKAEPTEANDNIPIGQATEACRPQGHWRMTETIAMAAKSPPLKSLHFSKGVYEVGVALKVKSLTVEGKALEIVKLGL